MTSEELLIIKANRMLGEFIGTLEAICMWDIPEELRINLQERIKVLKEIEIPISK